ncbi:FAD/FMN-containing dehydrogenase [Neorhizobium huautlense]|uniref:FAD/FMN-containing dehydrogenase n=1 Tax=Neorhizobium huautlense TaxID=67774 RepID=A0ABT9Q228_9HYPH|nr:FAD-binding oxidoreductase [Neorhizobium huautlense]MDP9840411.1 FAD/FMN-containing dehydrogenase [Neorhizobium huautlense]
MDFPAQLSSLLPAGAVLTGDDMSAYLQDWWGRQTGSALCVTLPKTTEDVAAIVRACADAGHAIVPQGGRTGLTGAGVPGAGDRPPVILSLSRMRRIRKIDAINGSVDVDAGCVLSDVQSAAIAADRLFPVSLGAEGSCQIGGIISTNAGGTNVLRYGTTRENVLGLEVVLPDGTIWDGMKALRKDNSGYALRHMFIGAEGTLGIITGAVLKLHPLPKAHATAWVGVSDPELALRLLNRLQSCCGERLTTFELMNAEQLASVIAHRPVVASPADTPWHLLIELADMSAPEFISEMLLAALGAAMNAGEILDAVIAQNGIQRDNFWALRHGTADANRNVGHLLPADISVPVSAVPQFLNAASAAVRDRFPGAEIVVVSHMGDGNVHFGVRFSHRDWSSYDDPAGTVVAVRTIVNGCADALGGSFTAEHGIGRKLVDELRTRTDQAGYQSMQRLKDAFDPHGIMNPGCVLREREKVS